VSFTGCLVGLFTLPFKAVYWFFKIIWEIAEFFSHHSHKRHRVHGGTRHVSRAPQKSPLPVPRTTRKTVAATSRTDTLHELSGMLKECLPLARATHLHFDTRLKAYNTALEMIDMMLQRNTEPNVHKSIREFETKVRDEIHALNLHRVSDSEAKESQDARTHFDMDVKSTNVSDRYYNLLSQIEAHKSQQAYRQMLDLCLKSVRLLPILVTETINEYGQWDIASIPSIEYACKYLLVLMDKEHLDEILVVLRPVRELKPWFELAEDAVRKIDIVRSLYQWIEEHPGFYQNKLGKALGVNGHSTANILHYAEQMGTISRVREGDSYKIYTIPKRLAEVQVSPSVE